MFNQPVTRQSKNQRGVGRSVSEEIPVAQSQQAYGSSLSSITHRTSRLPSIDPTGSNGEVVSQTGSRSVSAKTIERDPSFRHWNLLPRRHPVLVKTLRANVVATSKCVLVRVSSRVHLHRLSFDRFQNGFESLRTLIPELNDPSNAKISKAQMLECSKSIASSSSTTDRLRLQLRTTSIKSLKHETR